MNEIARRWFGQARPVLAWKNCLCPGPQHLRVAGSVNDVSGASWNPSWGVRIAVNGTQGMGLGFWPHPEAQQERTEPKSRRLPTFAGADNLVSHAVPGTISGPAPWNPRTLFRNSWQASSECRCITWPTPRWTALDTAPGHLTQARASFCGTDSAPPRQDLNRPVALRDNSRWISGFRMVGMEPSASVAQCDGLCQACIKDNKSRCWRGID